MKKSRRRLALCWLLICLNVAFIWGNSMLPGAASEWISLTLQRVLRFFLQGDGSGGGNGHSLLRKIAHFAEFGCLGMLLTWLMGIYQKPALLALAAGIGIAAADEIIQIFAPNRGPGILDVLLDSCGVAAGMIFLLAGYSISKKFKRHMEETL